MTFDLSILNEQTKAILRVSEIFLSPDRAGKIYMI